MVDLQRPFSVAAWVALAACSNARATPDEDRRSAPGRAGRPFVTYDAEFGRTWYDGKAELSSYALTYPRYGEPRAGGTAVAVFVSEHFDPQRMVKAEQATASTVPMIKLNLVQDFQTGIYDYNTMTSVYAALVDAAHLRRARMAKVMYGSQDWCGQVYQQATLTKTGLEHQMRSYFEGEADADRSFETPPNEYWEDGLWLWARRLAGPRVGAGETVEVPLLRSLETSRMKHIPVAWDRATLSEVRGTQTIEVPAGAFEVFERRVTVQRVPSRRTYSRGVVPDEGDRRSWRFWVEVAAPHRLVRWSRDDGLEATLVATQRLEYWDLQKTLHEPYGQRLGIARQSSPQPPMRALKP